MPPAVALGGFTEKAGGIQGGYPSPEDTMQPDKKVITTPEQTATDTANRLLWRGKETWEQSFISSLWFGRRWLHIHSDTRPHIVVRETTAELKRPAPHRKMPARVRGARHTPKMGFGIF